MFLFLEIVESTPHLILMVKAPILDAKTFGEKPERGSDLFLPLKP